MTRTKIIEYLYEKDVVRTYGAKYLKKFTTDQQFDLIMEVWLIICELPDEVLIDLWGQGKDHLTAYIKRVVEYSLAPNGKTRKLQKLLTTEIPVDFDCDITKEDDDEIPTNKYFIDTDIDSKLQEYEKKYQTND